MNRRLMLATASQALALLALAGSVQAQTYPDRPVTLVVPFSPGGGTDLLARLVSTKLEASLGAPVVVDNRPGASGAVAGAYVMSQPADGYTLLFGTSSTNAISPVLHDDKMGDMIGNFEPVSLVANSALILAVPADSPITDLKGYVAASAEQPITYGTFGVGSTPHLLGTLFASESGADLIHVPYKGSAPAVADVTGGHIDSAFLTVTALTASIKDDALRGLAVAAPERLSQFPDIPTFAEDGFDGLDDAGWFAIFAPKGVSKDIRTQVSDAVRTVLETPEAQKEFANLGVTAQGSTPDELAQKQDASVALVKGILSQTGIDVFK
ncbi:tripartite tricarboxylate transporter substrate binding protein [Pseudooceanicola sp. 216_PA32_1]|uniref:Tripartite tricarboxylate transporter substrate binding protein n=1 Tax=Pseudooceanicola pacificus TaxID=2676438 RepID=A0A844W4K6_9RHOB|nr:tripartite tricarboxylate transporter substrate binding protein [Pseudooceanicola pacificus]MWB79176.1 tripartite tricarboxylate transporter substrate binding protein [Pseudooceanicola pacificus]